MEIERKFLVREIPFNLKQYPSCEIRQGYLSFEPEIRIRKKDNTYYLTEKGSGSLVREENDKLISEKEYLAKEALVISDFVEKTRYKIPIHGGFTVELDIYHGKLNGLTVAEVEFDTLPEALAFKAPDWFGKEITDDPDYKNKNLLKNKSSTYKAPIYPAG